MYRTRMRAGSEYDIAANYEHLKGKLNELIHQSTKAVKRRSRDAKYNFENYVSDKPYKSVGMAVLAGLVLGYVMHKH